MNAVLYKLTLLWLIEKRRQKMPFALPLLVKKALKRQPKSQYLEKFM